MRGDRIHRGVWIGLALSALMHTGVGYVANTVNMGGSGGQHARPGAVDDGGLTLTLPDPEPAPVPDAEDPAVRKFEEMLAEQNPPTPPPPLLMVPPPPQEPPEAKLVLGIDKSDQKTPNWIGVATPTEHSAKLSDVTQPQFDLNPGSPGTPGGGVAKPAMEGPVPGDTPAPAPPAAEPSPSTKPKQDAVKAREGEADGHSRETTTTPPRPGDVGATGDKKTQPPAGAAQAVKADGPPSPLPGAREKPKGVDQAPEKGVDVAQAPEAIKPIEATKSVRPVEASTESKQAAAKPDNATPREPSPTSSTAGGWVSGADAPGEASGGGGNRPGDKSEKEADASSTEHTVVIRPGLPAAAQGLEITTRRPNFTHLTRVVANPERNPVFKVTFNAKGIVTRVKILESTGIKDVDEPVVNSIYQWTARGKALTELATDDPTSGLTVTFQIILR